MLWLKARIRLCTRKVCHEKYQGFLGKDTGFSQSFVNKNKKNFTAARHYDGFRIITKIARKDLEI